MSIVGDRPTKGARFCLDRIDGPPPGYVGEISTPQGDFPVRIEEREGGELVVTTEAGPDLAEKARLLVKTILRHAASEETPPPRRIERWRGEH